MHPFLSYMKECTRCYQSSHTHSRWAKTPKECIDVEKGSPKSQVERDLAPGLKIYHLSLGKCLTRPDQDASLERKVEIKVLVNCGSIIITAFHITR